MAFFVPASHDCHVFEWGLTVNQNQKKDYIRKQLWKDTSIYKKAHAFSNLPWNFSTGLLTRGCTYKKKIAYTRLSLSLLHWKREQEERLGGVGPSLGPTTWLPFLANAFRTWPAYGSLLLFRWWYQSKSPYQVVDLVEPHQDWCGTCSLTLGVRTSFPNWYVPTKWTGGTGDQSPQLVRLFTEDACWPKEAGAWFAMVLSCYFQSFYM